MTKKPSDDPTIVSLESARRRRQAEQRKPAAKPRASHEKAINWSKAPKFLLAVALFVLFAWAIRYVGSLLNPFG